MLSDQRSALVPHEEQHLSSGMPTAATGNPAQDLLRLLWMRRKLIALITCLSVALTIAYLWYATPLYTAYSRLYIEAHDPVIINDARAAMTVRTKNYLYTQCEVISSVPIVQRALQSAGIKELKTIQQTKDPIDYIQSNLDVSVGKKDDLVEVAMDAPYPDDAVKIVNAVVSAYIEHQSGQRKTTANDMERVLSKERTENEAALTAKMRELLLYKEANGQLSFEDDKENIIIKKLGTLSDALTKAELDAVRAKTIHESAVVMKDNAEGLKHLIETRTTSAGGPAAVDRQLDELQSQLTQLEVRLMLAEKQLAANHPQVTAARDAVENIKKRIADREKTWVEKYTAAALEDWNTAKRNEAAILAALADQQKLAMDLNQKATHFAMLQADVTRMQKVLELLDNQSKVNGLNGSAGGMDVSLLESGLVGDMPSKPRKVLDLAASVLFGLMFGSGIALVR